LLLRVVERDERTRSMALDFWRRRKPRRSACALENVLAIEPEIPWRGPVDGQPTVAAPTPSSARRNAARRCFASDVPMVSDAVPGCRCEPAPELEGCPIAGSLSLNPTNAARSASNVDRPGTRAHRVPARVWLLVAIWVVQPWPMWRTACWSSSR